LTQADIESTYAGFSSAFKNPNCQVVFKINGVVLVVKDKDYFIDIATFNARVYALFFKDQYRASEAEIDYQNADNLIIKFTQDSVNLMCKIKEEK
jgi:sulfur transfer complex TusBCD TusB component (DsrH family)